LKGLSYSVEPSVGDRSEYTYLAALTGIQFDEEYASQALRAKSDAITEFREEAENGTLPEIRNFAKQTLPTVEEHLRLIQDTIAQLIVTTAATTRGVGSLN